MPATNTHRLHDVEAVAFIGNDVIPCRTFEVGTDAVGVRAPSARAQDCFVRLQCHLDSEHWLDADAVLTDCRRFGGEWHWRLEFVSVREPSPAAFSAFVHQHPRRSSPTHAPPAPASSAPPPLSRPKPEERNLSELFRDALSAIEGKH
jgi:hypothetical protein